MRDTSMFPHPGIRLFLDGRPALFGDGPRNTTSMLEVFIRCVHDDIHRFDRDIPLNDLNALPCWKYMFAKNGVHENILPPLKQ